MGMPPGKTKFSRGESQKHCTMFGRSGQSAGFAGSEKNLSGGLTFDDGAYIIDTLSSQISMCACSSVDRVPGYEPVGRRFESCQARQKP